MYGTRGRGLFGGKAMPDEYAERRQTSLGRVERADVNELLTTEIEDLVEMFVDPFSPATVRWDEVSSSDVDNVTVQREDTFGRKVNVTNARCRLTVPVDGDAILLTYYSHSEAPINPIEGVASPGQISFTWTGSLEATPEAMLQWLEQRRSLVERFLVHVNNDATRFNEQMSSAVRSAIETRKDLELKRRQLVARLPFPVTRKPEATTPVRAKRVRVRLESRPAAPMFTPEPELLSGTYEAILSDCVSMATVFERTPLGGIGEEQLRNIFLGMLNTNFTGLVAGELFNGAGKIDICIRSDDRNVFIGECKFYDGPASVVKAVDQVLSYLVWRDTKAALLLFVKGGSFTDCVTKSVAAVADHPQCKRQLPSDAPERRTDYVFARADDTDRTIRLALLPFRLLG